MTSTYIKSKLTLEDVRPYISGIFGMFGVPFDDGGFMMSEQEIKKAKAEYKKMFIASVALILGITKDEAKKKVVAKKDKSKYQCWKHNVNYEVNIKTPKHPTISASIYGNDRITLNVTYGYKCGISYFEMDANGVIYQSPICEITSIEDIKRKITKANIDDINKELKKLKKVEANAVKGLATTRSKIEKLEKELKEYEQDI